MRTFKSSIGDPNNISLDNVCTLLSIETIQDDLGQFIKIEKPYLVFCSKLSITRAEHSSAGTSGHKPELMLIVDSDSYENETLVEFENKKYSIYKTFQRVDSFTELYCEVKTGD